MTATCWRMTGWCITLSGGFDGGWPSSDGRPARIYRLAAAVACTASGELLIEEKTGQGNGRYSWQTDDDERFNRDEGDCFCSLDIR
jgi:hypothetical protein